jgi:GcrA cell cycle regulator
MARSKEPSPRARAALNGAKSILAREKASTDRDGALVPKWKSQLRGMQAHTTAVSGVSTHAAASLPQPAPKRISAASRARTCMWPHGDPKEPGFHYCGDQPVVAGKPYCETHCNQAYQKRGSANDVDPQQDVPPGRIVAGMGDQAA